MRVVARGSGDAEGGEQEGARVAFEAVGARPRPTVPAGQQDESAARRRVAVDRGEQSVRRGLPVGAGPAGVRACRAVLGRERPGDGVGLHGGRLRWAERGGTTAAVPIGAAAAVHGHRSDHGQRAAVPRRRTRARVDVDAAAFDGERPRWVVGPEAEVLRTETEGHGGAPARLEADPLEATQSAHRLGDAGRHVVDVELDDLVARPLAGVGDRQRHLDRLASLQGVPRDALLAQLRP